MSRWKYLLRQAICASYYSEIDYFADFASRILQMRDRSSEERNSPDAWGLIAARLGRKKNCQKFVSSFWFPDEKAVQPKSRAEQGFLRYLQSVKAKPLAWQKAVERFSEALKQESTMRAERAGTWSSIEISAKLTEQLGALQSSFTAQRSRQLKFRSTYLPTTDLQNAGKATLAETVAARAEHLRFKPTLIDALFTFGKAYREWRTQDSHWQRRSKSTRNMRGFARFAPNRPRISS